MVFYRLVQKYSTFRAWCKHRTQKYTFWPLKNPKIEKFIANNSPKKFLTVKNLQYDGAWNRGRVYTKIGKIRPLGAEKSRLKELKRRGMSRTRKKNETVLTSPCAKRICSPHLNIGAKVLSARLPEVLTHSTTALIRGLCNAREHVAKSGKITRTTIIR